MKKYMLLLLLFALLFAGCGNKSTKDKDSHKVPQNGMMPPDGPPPGDAFNGTPPPMPPDGQMPPMGKNGEMPPMPPGGKPGDMPPMGNGSPMDQNSVELKGAYTLSGKKASLTGKTIKEDKKDSSDILVSKGGELTLHSVTLLKKGDSSNPNMSNFTGLNGALVVQKESKADISASKIITESEGANGVVSTGKDSHISLKDVTISTSKNSSRGLHATYGGSIKGTNISIETEGDHCAALATDRGEGTVTVYKSKGITRGEGSPGIYSTGTIKAVDSVFTAYGSEAAVVEGKNSIELVNSTIAGEKKCGVMIYQSFSGDSDVGESHFTMQGGKLSAAAGPLLYITNTKCEVLFENVEFSKSSQFISIAPDRWGKKGANGGNAQVTLKAQQAEGDITVDKTSSLTLSMTEGSTLNGAVNRDGEGTVNVSIDSNSTWTLDGDSRVDALALESVNSIVSQGHTLYYNKSNPDNQWLKGKTMKLADGGKIAPL
jgi:hypothetical protein